MDDKIKQLEARQAKAKAAAKKATADLARAKRKAKEQERKDAQRKEQEAALEFYRKYRDFIAWMQDEKIWNVEQGDGSKVKVTRYEFCIRQMGGK